PDVVEEVDHRVDVHDARDVPEDHGPARKEASGQDRQRAVLVAGRLDTARKRPSSFDREGFGCAPDDRGPGHRGSLPTPWRPLANAPGRPSRSTRRASRSCATPSPWRPQSAGTHGTSKRTSSSGASSLCSTTSTTRSTPRSTSIHRTARRSCATTVTPKK